LIKPKQLERNCPSTSSKLLNSYCLTVENLKLIFEKSRTVFNQTNDSTIDTKNLCVNYCLSYFGSRFAFLLDIEQSNKCICIRDLDINLLKEMQLKESECNYANSLNVFVHETGFFDTRRISYDLFKAKKNKKSIYNSLFGSSMVGKFNRIVFIFTLNGRNDRFVIRILKKLYHAEHFYYFHVDEKAVYLRKKVEIVLNKLKLKKNLKNIEMAKWSMSPIWGGASLLKSHFRIMGDLVKLKKTNQWNWDYMINLSESDYPIK
jgi:hypothetical protein